MAKFCNQIPRNFFLRDVAVASVETRSALADLINYFQTTPILNYGKKTV